MLFHAYHRTISIICLTRSSSATRSPSHPTHKLRLLPSSQLCQYSTSSPSLPTPQSEEVFRKTSYFLKKVNIPCVFHISKAAAFVPTSLNLKEEMKQTSRIDVLSSGSTSSSSMADARSPPVHYPMIEIAANLTDGMFRGVYHGKAAHDPDLDAVLARAWETGVQKIIITGGSLAESREALALAEKDERLFCTVGVHPTRCSEFEESGDSEGHLQQLLLLAQEGAARGKVVAIGECGLDYDRLVFCDKLVQQRYFEAQFKLAEATGLPMFLHMRAAADDFLDIIRRNLPRFKAGVVHSFTGTAEDRDAILAIDKLFIGVNGCSLKTEENLAVVRGIPADRMMLETDSPYCDIRPTHAGFKHVKTIWPSKKKESHQVSAQVKSRNEPCNLRQVLEVVCGERNEDYGSLADTVFENTSRVFFKR